MSSFYQVIMDRFHFICYLVNGGWSKWSHWVPCSHVKRGSSIEGCMCQQRQCNEPTPAHGGKACEGVSIQVANCTGLLRLFVCLFSI